MNAIEITNVTYRYENNTDALKNLTLQIPHGAKVALLGPNGAGKSTLLHHLNGLKIPNEGSVTIMGNALTKKNASSIRQQVGLVFQDPDDQVFSGTVWRSLDRADRMYEAMTSRCFIGNLRFEKSPKMMQWDFFKTAVAVVIIVGLIVVERGYVV